MTETIRSYHLGLEKALVGKKPFTSPNADIFHAATIVSGAFKHAQESLRVLSTTLDERLYCTEFKLGLLRDFLGKGGELKVLVEQDLPTTHNIWFVTKEYPGKVSVKKVPANYSQALTANFLVVDDFGFRFETDKSKREALVCFHEPDAKEMVDGLTDLFEHLFARSADLLP